MTGDLRSAYDPLIKQIAALYTEDAELYQHLQSLAVTAEEWDVGRGGGHLWFEKSPFAPDIERDTVDAWAQDADGMPIDIILHSVDGRIAWGEWVRADGRPIHRWPPPSVTLEPPRFGGSPN